MTPETIADEIGVDVSRETFDDLQTYHDLLITWSKTHNLIGPKEADFLWERHILDCLQLWPFVSSGTEIIDMGSGAGLPGLILAIMSKNNGGPTLNLVESSTKRCAFLRHVSGRLRLPVRVLNKRVEDVSRETFDIVTARAVSDLPNLLKMSSPWLENGAKGVFLKGQTYQQELTEASRYWNFNSDITPSRSDSLGVVLSLSEVRSVHG